MPRKTVKELDAEVVELRSHIDTRFDDLVSLITSNGNGSAPAGSTRKTRNAKNGKQQFLRTTFVPKGGRLIQVVNDVNALSVGGVVSFKSAKTYSDVNKQWGENQFCFKINFP